MHLKQEDNVKILLECVQVPFSVSVPSYAGPEEAF